MNRFHSIVISVAAISLCLACGGRTSDERRRADGSLSANDPAPPGKMSGQGKGLTTTSGFDLQETGGAPGVGGAPSWAGSVGSPPTPVLPDPIPDAQIGQIPTSCGTFIFENGEEIKVEPVDCTKNGDANAECVFAHHCMCILEDGFACNEDVDWNPNAVHMECSPGVVCVPKR